MLSELFEELPEAGDPPKPKLVFFFDEAHLLFNDAPKALMDKIEQVVRLIRSKGVGVYFRHAKPRSMCGQGARPPSWANRCNMRSALSPRATRRRSRRLPQTSGTQSETRHRQVITELSRARRWCRFL